MHGIRGLGYDEEFGSNEVLYFHQKKRQMVTCAIISASEHSERKNSLVRMGDPGHPFFTVSLVSCI